MEEFLSAPLEHELAHEPHLRASRRRFLDGDQLTLADCNLLPKLNIVQVSAGTSAPCPAPLPGSPVLPLGACSNPCSLTNPCTTSTSYMRLLILCSLRDVPWPPATLLLVSTSPWPWGPPWHTLGMQCWTVAHPAPARRSCASTTGALGSPRTCGACGGTSTVPGKPRSSDTAAPAARRLYKPIAPWCGHCSEHSPWSCCDHHGPACMHWGGQ